MKLASNAAGMDQRLDTSSRTAWRNALVRRTDSSSYLTGAPIARLSTRAPPLNSSHRYTTGESLAFIALCGQLTCLKTCLLCLVSFHTIHCRMHCWCLRLYLIKGGGIHSQRRTGRASVAFLGCSSQEGSNYFVEALPKRLSCPSLHFTPGCVLFY
jgi:hypothetical protein